MVALHFLLGRERASDDGPRAQDVEEPGGHLLRSHLFGLGARLAKGQGAARDGGD
jgi:hypothetical protein